MNIWDSYRKDKCNLKSEGFSLHFERGIDSKLRDYYISFSKWLRKEYVFPTHINIYLKNCETIKLNSGIRAYGSFKYFEKNPPRIIIPSKVEKKLLNEFSVDELYEQILSSFVHELTHYYQYVSGLEQTKAVSERQANHFRYSIIEKYYDEMK